MDNHLTPLPGSTRCPGVLKHVQRMVGSFSYNGQRIPYIYIYAHPQNSGPNAPLEFITAKESGFEGIACVDDVARRAPGAANL